MSVKSLSARDLLMTFSINVSRTVAAFGLIYLIFLGVFNKQLNKLRGDCWVNKVGYDSAINGLHIIFYKLMV